MMVLAGAAALWCAAPLAVTGAAEAGVASAAAGAVTLAGTWRTAIEVPGSSALNKGGDAQVFSVSCASAGNCAAGGDYLDGSYQLQAFVASERNGAWRRAVEVPGSGALNKSGHAEVSSVSCASAGNCAAGGDYADSSGHSQAFVASERNGVWRRAVEVPGSGPLNKGGDAGVFSVSCASAGNCAAGGSYADASGHLQAFVASERNGTWRTAVQVPGSRALNKGGTAGVFSVSCVAAGNCAAGGFYTDGSGHSQAFVASERNGTWRTAVQVPGSRALNKGGDAEVYSVSCAAAGNCAAGGFYADGSGHSQAFVAGERNGTWRTAVQVPGSGALNEGGTAGVFSVSCAAAGNCAAGGFYTDSSGHSQAFVAGEQNGTWRTAVQVPGSGALNEGGVAEVASVSCAAAGNCAAGGFYADSSGHLQAFVAGEQNGTWRTAVQVPGSGALNKGGDAGVFSVSCARAGNCAAGGDYADGSGHLQAFVASQT